MNNNKRIIVSIIITIVVVIVGGFTIYNIVVSKKAKKSLNSSITSTLLPNVKDFYKIGQAIKINDISMVIDKIEISNGTKTDRPDEGTEYLIVTVTIKNGNKSKIHYDDNDFQIQDSSGGINNSVITTMNAYQTFKSGTLPPNGDVTGTMTFLPVNGATGLSVNYNGDIFGHNIIHFKLN